MENRTEEEEELWQKSLAIFLGVDIKTYRDLGKIIDPPFKAQGSDGADASQGEGGPEGIDSLYRMFKIPKKNGEMRRIEAPIEPLKGVQRTVAKKLTKIFEEHYANSMIHGFTRNRSIITNCRGHVKKRYVLNMDLEDFFGSFTFKRVIGYFHHNRYFQLSWDQSEILAKIVCYKDRLPQGAPSSPVITNLIASILDQRLLKIARKYRLQYTRYADDLTFSTNDKVFFSHVDDIISELTQEIEKSGFRVNEKKTRVSYRSSRQEVTGLLVNDRIGVRREYYKQTRSMLHHLYLGKPVEYKGEKVSLQQLEGRLSFINQIDRYINVTEKEKGHENKKGLNGREKQYQQFLFYKYFFHPERPLIVTGENTDVDLLQAALRALYKDFPDMVQKKEDGTFDIKVSFLKRSPRLRYFLHIGTGGEASLKEIYHAYQGRNTLPNLAKPLKKGIPIPPYPVMLLYANEQEGEGALNKLLEESHTQRLTGQNIFARLCDNLYVLTYPMEEGCESKCIEDLFSKNIPWRKESFSPDMSVRDKARARRSFVCKVLRQEDQIDFSGFYPLLNEISRLLKEYSTWRDDHLMSESEEKMWREVFDLD